MVKFKINTFFNQKIKELKILKKKVGERL